ncbi:hypothetical protein [Roseateles sp.]|uniref:hypothetical protein n=1 Tax=Roseateles sp. TaxID=1971397 RepID=UPI003D147F01
MSGISVAYERLRAAARNTANQGAGDFRRYQVESQTLETGGVKIQLRQLAVPSNTELQDLVERGQGAKPFAANLRMLRTPVSASGALLGIQA